MSRDLVKKHYSEYAEREWERLVRDPYHRLEFETTMRCLSKYLPSRGLVLDAGGGPGRYTIELARLGYQMTLLDLTPTLLEIARDRIRDAGVEANVREVVEGSIEDLSCFEDGSFDAVLCLGGPLSHVLDKDGRDKAVDELIRVAKLGSPIFVSVIGRLAVCVNAFVELWPDLKSNPDLYRKIAATGRYEGDSGFTACHFFLPDELRDEFEGKAEVLEMVGLEGIFSTHGQRYNEVISTGEYNKILGDLHKATCTKPSIVGISEHMMLICRKALNIQS